MSDLRRTIEVYNQSANEFADYFRSVSASRKEDIETAFNLIGDKVNPSVLEIGCADGRDAEEILKKTNSYIGIDASKDLINLAHKNLPDATFLTADVRDFDFPDNLDIIFAFASLVHLDREEITEVFNKVHGSLVAGGVFYISLKRGPSYQPYIKSDQYGDRQFYLYSLEDIKNIAGSRFEISDFSSGFVTDTNTEWVEVALKKIDP